MNAKLVSRTALHSAGPAVKAGQEQVAIQPEACDPTFSCHGKWST